VTALLIGWLVTKWHSRSRRVQVAVISLEGLTVLGHIVMVTFGSDLYGHAPIGLTLIMPIVVLFLLSLPSARTWFNG